MGNGLNIILVARRQNLLDEKSTVLQSKYGIKVKTIQADLTKPEDIQKVIDGTKDLEVGLLIPGAAFETHGAFYKIPVEKELALIQLNISSTMVLTHHFTGEMVKRKKRWCCINFQYDRSHAQSLFSPITPVQKLISSTLEPPLIENLKNTA